MRRSWRRSRAGIHLSALRTSGLSLRRSLTGGWLLIQIASKPALAHLLLLLLDGTAFYSEKQPLAGFARDFWGLVLDWNRKGSGMVIGVLGMNICMRE